MKARSGPKNGDEAVQTPTKAARGRKAGVDSASTPKTKRVRGRSQKTPKGESAQAEPSSPLADDEGVTGYADI